MPTTPNPRPRPPEGPRAPQIKMPTEVSVIDPATVAPRSIRLGEGTARASNAPTGARFWSGRRDLLHLRGPATFGCFFRSREMLRANHEHLNGLASARQRLESFGLLKHRSSPVEQVTVCLALKYLHDQIAAGPEPGAGTIKKFIAESNRSVMVAKVIAGRIRRHVGEHHVKRRAPSDARSTSRRSASRRMTLGGRPDGSINFRSTPMTDPRGPIRREAT